MILSLTTPTYHRIRYFFTFFNILESFLILLVFIFTGLAHSLSVTYASIPWGAPYLQISLCVLVFYLSFYIIKFPQHIYLSFFLDRQAGLSNLRFKRWIGDEFKSNVLGFVMTLLMIQGFYAVLRHQTANWWFTLTLAWLLMTIFISWIFPSWIVPLFYPMKKLPDNPLRKKLHGLMERLSLKVQDLYEIALSRKTKKSNAAVIGFGSSRRIVLGDTLIRDFTGDEIEMVLAHEIGHHKLGHITKRIVFQLLGVSAGLFLFERLSPHGLHLLGYKSLTDLALYPWLLLVMLVVNVFSLPVVNGITRSTEREADRYALQNINRPDVFISAMDKLGKFNWADINPPAWIEWLLFSHPSIKKRIDFAKNYRVH